MGLNVLKRFFKEQIGAVRCFKDHNEPMFIFNDLCKAFGFTTERTRRVVREALNDKEITMRKVKTDGGAQNTLCVTRMGLFRMACRSKSENAAEFLSWIIDVVIPAIDSHGSYTLGQEGLAPEQLTKLYEEQAKLKATVEELLAENANKDERIEELEFALNFGEEIPIEISEADIRDLNEYLLDKGDELKEINFDFDSDSDS